MLSLSNICKNSHRATCVLYQHRNKTNWKEAQKKKRSPTTKALNHFDDFYGSIFGDKWKPMREALLRKSKYVAVINNYGNPEQTIDMLKNKGAHCLSKLMSIQNKFNEVYSAETQQQPEKNSTDGKLEQYASKVNTDAIEKLYSNNKVAPENIEFNEEVKVEAVTKIRDVVTPNKSLDESLSEAMIDESRFIDPTMGITSEAFYQYIPATKLKGMEDWVLESSHYSYQSKETDFPLLIEPEAVLEYPEHLKVYTYEMDSECTTFPEPKRCDTGVYNYYPMDGGSVLAVLALGLRPGDRVLDLCSAPGGKSLVALQTLLPDVLVCNDISISRSNRTQRVFREYLIDYESNNKWRERVILTKVDGRNFLDSEGFDKVLVDVPCTTDRHSLIEDDNNIFRPNRIRERLRIQEMQTQLLLNALKLVHVGGTVVYSTCSLSPVQNDGVVHAALKQAFENYNVVATVKDLTQAMSCLSSTLELGSGASAPKYGQLVVPSVSANFGPSYISKLVRVK